MTASIPRRFRLYFRFHNAPSGGWHHEDFPTATKRRRFLVALSPALREYALTDGRETPRPEMLGGAAVHPPSDSEVIRVRQKKTPLVALNRTQAIRLAADARKNELAQAAPDKVGEHARRLRRHPNAALATCDSKQEVAALALELGVNPDTGTTEIGGRIYSFRCTGRDPKYTVRLQLET